MSPTRKWDMSSHTQTHTKMFTHNTMALCVLMSMAKLMATHRHTYMLLTYEDTYTQTYTFRNTHIHTHTHFNFMLYCHKQKQTDCLGCILRGSTRFNHCSFQSFSKEVNKRQNARTHTHSVSSYSSYRVRSWIWLQPLPNSSLWCRLTP